MEAESPANLSLANDLTYVYHFKCLKLIGPNFSPLLTRQNFFALSLEKYSEGRFRIYEISGQHIPQIIVSFANDFIYANDFIFPNH